MNTKSIKKRLALSLSLLLIGAAPQAFAQDTDKAKQANQQKQEIVKKQTQNQVKKVKDGILLPGIFVNLKEKYVDIDVQVVQFDSQIELELLICMPGTLEHESLFRLNAKAAHLHQGLLLIGAKPGKPQTIVPHGDAYKIDPIKGQKLKIFLLNKKDKQGKFIEQNVGDWLYNPKKKYTLKDNTWLFAGSMIGKDSDNKPVYYADHEGAIASLVHFGSEVLGRNTKQSNRGGVNLWYPHPKRVPKIGTKTKLRIKPLPPEKNKPKAKPAKQSDKK